MDLFRKTTTIRYSFVIFTFLISIILLLAIIFTTDLLSGEKWSSIIPGLLTGFIVALFQAILSLQEIKRIDEYNNLKIKKILSHRKDASYYGNLISKSKTEIKVLGVTAQRFLEDFADENSKATESEKVLLQALQQSKIKVKILIADDDFLVGEENKRKAKQAKSKLEYLSNKYPAKFEYCYYKHKPTHSIVIIDNECIVGPIFPELESKYTPAIHLINDSPFAEPYIDYFNQEWEQCRNN